MSQVDLEQLRDVVLDARRPRDDRPRERRRQVFVTPGGKVVLGDDLEDEGRQLSEVHLAVFA